MRGGWQVSSYAALAIVLASVSQAETCDAIAQDVQYCGPSEKGAQFITEVIYPDLVGKYNLQDDPLVTSAVVVMPFDREIGSWDDVLNMLADQMMFMGSAPAVSLTDDAYDAGLIDGVSSVRAEVLGRRSDGEVNKAFVIDATPVVAGVLMVITSSETEDEVTQDLRDLHSEFLAGFEVTG